MIGHVLVSAAEILHHNMIMVTLSMIMMTRDRQSLLLLGIISEFPEMMSQGRFKYFRTEFKVRKCIYLMSKN